MIKNVSPINVFYFPRHKYFSGISIPCFNFNGYSPFRENTGGIFEGKYCYEGLALLHHFMSSSKDAMTVLRMCNASPTVKGKKQQDNLQNLNFPEHIIQLNVSRQQRANHRKFKG